MLAVTNVTAVQAEEFEAPDGNPVEKITVTGQKIERTL